MVEKIVEAAKLCDVEARRLAVRRQSQKVLGQFQAQRAMLAADPLAAEDDRGSSAFCRLQARQGATSAAG
jgi:hypothetical protein